MTTPLAERRKKSALRWVIAALATLAVAAIAVTISARTADPNRVLGLVVPGLASEIDQAQKISVVSHDAAYRITKTERGWAMTDRGDFPVRAERLGQLTQGLIGLARVRRMTNDPTRHEQLGVADPAQGGNGVLVQIENAQGAFLVDLIVGVLPRGAYVRKPGDNQVWAVRGDLPPLRDPSSWLDLQPLELNPDLIARAEISPPIGPAYILQRGAEGAFAFVGAQAALRPLSTGALAQTAAHATRLQPVDVLPASAVHGTTEARVRLTLTNGAAIDAEVIRFQDRPWIKLNARAAEPSGDAPARAINERAAAWAYGLAGQDVDALVPPLDALVTSAPTP